MGGKNMTLKEKTNRLSFDSKCVSVLECYSLCSYKLGTWTEALRKNLLVDNYVLCWLTDSFFAKIRFIFESSIKLLDFRGSSYKMCNYIHLNCDFGNAFQCISYYSAGFDTANTTNYIHEGIDFSSNDRSSMLPCFCVDLFTGSWLRFGKSNVLYMERP